MPGEEMPTETVEIGRVHARDLSAYGVLELVERSSFDRDVSVVEHRVTSVSVVELQNIDGTAEGHVSGEDVYAVAVVDFEVMAGRQFLPLYRLAGIDEYRRPLLILVGPLCVVGLLALLFGLPCPLGGRQSFGFLLDNLAGDSFAVVLYHLLTPSCSG